MHRSQSKHAIGVLFAIVCLGSAVLVQAATQHAAEEAGLKSVENELAATIVFTNSSPKTVKVFWLDFDGKRKLYRTLSAGESYEQPTYLMHPWLITDDADNAWWLYFADAQPRTIAIKAPAR